MSVQTATQAIRQEAHRLGFSLVGVCPATTTPSWDRFRDWLSCGYAGEMSYLPDRREAYRHPSSVLTGVRSLVMLAMDYRTAEPPAGTSTTGRISRYAWGDADYHDVIHVKLKSLVRFVRAVDGEATVRGIVDTAPLLEREFAQLAGLGWLGKNTLLINPSRGSWFFLAALLTDLELTADAPFLTDHCGTCTACLDACPTQAFPQPYVLDATRCVSYLTIELRRPIPAELREGVGNWLFGCDICQDVCPWNRRAPRSDEPSFAPRDDLYSADLLELLSCDEERFRERFRQTPMWRTKRRGLLRNAAIVLGNQREPSALGALVRALDDTEPLVRGAAAWAIGRIGADHRRDALLDRLARETDPHVRAELERVCRS
ncbi:MAG: tRNA epoxyqueuosine(34) reductase QueG [Pirellulaceae bacterium]|nr:tRNA epoxyqueuosine(34) reductase QueG [Pirellulaceae bacterium]MDP7017620.1 tRNA epoxyqueuosine(34) reductase QueG [Pirellulaceae bacterium]